MTKKTKEIRKAIGVKLRLLREHNELSLQDLAERCDLTETNLARIEEGRYSAPIDVIQTIAQELGATLAVVN